MHTLSQRLDTVLRPQFPPVALRFVDQRPAGARTLEEVRPSACGYWRAAETETFYAPAEDHHGCTVGTMVMGFPLEQIEAALGAVVTTMVDCGYLSAAEAAAIPTVAGTSSGIVYGPLAQATEPPDVVLLWLDAKQLMLLNEAAGTAAWHTPEASTVTGRPGCAAVPRALSGSGPAVSTGCIGMRTFTGIPDHLMLVAVPGEGLESVVTDLERVAAANGTMERVYRSMLAAAPAPDGTVVGAGTAGP